MIKKSVVMLDEDIADTIKKVSLHQERIDNLEDGISSVIHHLEEMKKAQENHQKDLDTLSSGVELLLRRKKK